MNKIRFIFAGITFFVGLITLLLTSIIKSIIPMLGYIAFQIAAKGSYEAKNYAISFEAVNIASIILVLLGIIAMIVFCLKEKCK